MNIFEESSRTICTRGVVLSKNQMENFRIRKIFNSFGDPEFLNDEHAEEMLDNFIKRGEFCLLEATNDGKLYKISLITFEDIWSRNVFALKNMDYYNGFPDLITLYN
jgi:hypothetical protein